MALALLGVVLLAGLGVGGFLLVRLATADDPCESVAAAATDGLATVLTIEGADLDGDFVLDEGEVVIGPGRVGQRHGQQRGGGQDHA